MRGDIVHHAALLSAATLILVCSLLCGGCASRSANPVAGGQPPATDGSALASLPWPPTTPRAVSDVARAIPGKDYVSTGGAVELHHNSVRLHSETGLSWALYSVGGLVVKQLTEIELQFSMSSTDNAGLWIGLANFAGQRWEWYDAGAAPWRHVYEKPGDYVDGSGAAYFVAVSSQPDYAQLDYWTVRTSGEPSGWLIPLEDPPATAPANRLRFIGTDAEHPSWKCEVSYVIADAPDFPVGISYHIDADPTMPWSEPVEYASGQTRSAPGVYTDTIQIDPGYSWNAGWENGDYVFLVIHGDPEGYIDVVAPYLIPLKLEVPEYIPPRGWLKPVEEPLSAAAGRNMRFVGDADYPEWEVDVTYELSSDVVFPVDIDFDPDGWDYWKSGDPADFRAVEQGTTRTEPGIYTDTIRFSRRDLLSTWWEDGTCTFLLIRGSGAVGGDIALYRVLLRLSTPARTPWWPVVEYGADDVAPGVNLRYTGTDPLAPVWRMDVTYSLPVALDYPVQITYDINSEPSLAGLFKLDKLGVPRSTPGTYTETIAFTAADIDGSYEWHNGDYVYLAMRMVNGMVVTTDYFTVPLHLVVPPG